MANAALGSGSRLKPFPPAVRPTPGEELAGFGMGAAPQARQDPYTGVAEPNGLAVTEKQVVPPGTASPVNGPAKTPRTRQSVKDTAKPSGPIHPVKAFPGIQEKFAEKRAALMAELGGGGDVQRFLIHDDDTGKGGEDVVETGLMD